MEKFIITPFVRVGDFVFNEKRNNILPKINLELRKTSIENVLGNNYIIDDYKGALAYYNQVNNKLFYVLFTPLIQLIYENEHLFEMNSQELFNFLKRFDMNLLQEDYVGFGSKLLGIDVYTPNFVEDPNSEVEAISVAIKGYFDVIYEGGKLNLNLLQK